MSYGSQFPFWAHALIELPAGINFLFRPSEQLSAPAPQAEAIVRQYGVLLLVSAIIALTFSTRKVDNTSRNVSGALSIYHLAPMARAYSRINTGVFNFGKALGGPRLHLMVHTICFLSLFQLAVRGREKPEVAQKKGE